MYMLNTIQKYDYVQTFHSMMSFSEKIQPQVIKYLKITHPTSLP